MKPWPRWRAARPAAAWSGSGYADSTLSPPARERARKGLMRWSWAGVACGALVALLVFAPATWLADAVAAGTQQRLLLADARGTVWNGSAVPVLAGGPDSRSAALLPGRASWRVGLRGLAIELHLRQPCCIDDPLVLLLRPGLGRMSLQLLPGSRQVGEWPAAWTVGLGAPWNTLRLDGTLRLLSRGLTLESAAGRWVLTGQAELELNNVASPLTTLDRLGSYSLQLNGAEGQPPAFTLSTLEGVLQLEGSGQWTGAHWRFRGEARAAPGAEEELNNLLNFFGRRQGALSLISIG